MSDFGHIGGEVRRELALGPAAGMAELVAAWPGAVGEQIAAQAWPARIARDRPCIVAVSSSVWAFELTQLEGEIRTRLEKPLGKTRPCVFGLPSATFPRPGQTRNRMRKRVRRKRALRTAPRANG